MLSWASVISFFERRQALKLALAGCALCAASLCAQAEDFGQWLPVRDVDLRIVPGSALDFSALVDSPADLQQRIGINAAGRLAEAEGKGERQRFLCAPLVYSGPHGGFPSKAEIDELAKQLRLHGYGLARLHLVDAALMKGRKKDFDYDPEQLDRFYYLLAALKKQGIRWMIDAATSWNGAYGDVGGRFDRGRHKLKLSVHYDEESQAHWKKMVATILDVRNPYTGTVILEDPALTVLTLFNELGVNYGANRGYPPELNKRFKAWKKAQGLRAEGERDDDDEDGPKRQEVSARAALMQRFVTETERATAKWMSEYVRSLGYKGLVTAYNNGKSIQSAAARGAMDVVSLHGYHDIPEENARPGSEQEGDSAIGVELAYVQYFGIHRYMDRPFIVDEYNHAYWNPWRREAGISLPAYAALQDWDAVCRYSNPVHLRYNKDGHRRARSLTPFGVGLDPVARAGETLAALLYARGDVATARGQVPVAASAEFFNGPASAVNAMPTSISRLSLVTGVGLVNESRSQKAGIQADAADSQSKKRWYAGALSRDDEGWRRNLRRLRDSGLLPKDNRSAPDGAVFESDTGQLLLETQQKRMRVQTPRTEAVVFANQPPPATAHLKIQSADAPALVALSAVDAQDLKDSRRMLLIVATDAVNTGDRFSADRKRLEALGRLPALIQPIKLKLRLRGLSGNAYALHALNLKGERVQSLETESSAEGLSFSIDTAALANGPTTYFELVAR